MKKLDNGSFEYKTCKEIARVVAEDAKENKLSLKEIEKELLQYKEDYALSENTFNELLSIFWEKLTNE